MHHDEKVFIPLSVKSMLLRFLHLFSKNNALSFMMERGKGVKYYVPFDVRNILVFAIQNVESSLHYRLTSEFNTHVNMDEVKIYLDDIEIIVDYALPERERMANITLDNPGE